MAAEFGKASIIPEATRFLDLFGLELLPSRQ